jgi:hypothetical protein
MKVKVVFPSELEATVYGVTVAGAKVALREVIIEPNFFRPDARPTCIYAESQDQEGETIHKYVATLSGTNGAIQVTQLKPTVTKYDRQRYEQADEEPVKKKGPGPEPRKKGGPKPTQPDKP